MAAPGVFASVAKAIFLYHNHLTIPEASGLDFPWAYLGTDFFLTIGAASFFRRTCANKIGNAINNSPEIIYRVRRVLFIKSLSVTMCVSVCIKLSLQLTVTVNG